MPITQITISSELLPLIGPAVGAFATLIAVAVTSSFNVWVAGRTTSRQNKQKDKELRLQKLEELYILCDKNQRYMAQNAIDYRRCLLGLVTYSAYLIEAEKRTGFSEEEEARLFMLIHVYFPELGDNREFVTTAKWKLHHLLIDPKAGNVDAQSLMLSEDEFVSACARLKVAVCIAGQRMFK